MDDATREHVLRLFMPKVQKTETCWLWTASLFPNGYGQFRTNLIPNRGVAHRASWLLHIGDIPEGLWVLHHCDVRRCQRPNHLFLGTAKDNTEDMISKQRHTAGEHSVKAKLTEAQVMAIRADTRSTEEIARDYAVSVPQINRILAGKNWSHLPVSPRPPRYRLTLEDAEAIRQDDRSTRELADQYGVTAGHIRQIKSGRVLRSR